MTWEDVRPLVHLTLTVLLLSVAILELLKGHWMNLLVVSLALWGHASAFAAWKCAERWQNRYVARFIFGPQRRGRL